MKQKIIRDLVHGYIKIDENIAEIIDTPSFQRLKDIAQLTAHHLYPSANHTRFEHSLGVMHLSEVFFTQLKIDISFDDADISEEKAFVNLKIASLLHDVGHGPFSHLGEHFYDRNEILAEIKNIDPAIGSILASGAKHELMSCFIILKIFKPIIDNNKYLNEFIEYELICRIITGNFYKRRDKWIQDILVEILNSSSVDVDKLDYLMRDNKMCGDISPKIDFERLILSLKIDSEKRISYKPIGISSLISLKDSRDFLYLWVYNHHTVVYTDFLYRQFIEHIGNEKNTKSKQENKINIKELFSTKSISEKYVSDKEIEFYLFREFTDTDSVISKKLLNQLILRQFLKPIWKTIYDYSLFMNESFDERVRIRVEEDINDSNDNDKNIRNIVNKIIEVVGCDVGDVFLIKRSNKFYSMAKKLEFFVNFEKHGDISLNKIFPERNFKENYSEIAFYLFTKKEFAPAVKDSFINIMKNSLYRD